MSLELPHLLRAQELPGAWGQRLANLPANARELEKLQINRGKPAAKDPQNKEQIHISSARHQKVSQNPWTPHNALLLRALLDDSRVQLPRIQWIEIRLALLRWLLPLGPLGLCEGLSSREGEDRGQWWRLLLLGVQRLAEVGQTWRLGAWKTPQAADLWLCIHTPRGVVMRVQCTLSAGWAGIANPIAARTRLRRRFPQAEPSKEAETEYRFC